MIRNNQDEPEAADLKRRRFLAALGVTVTGGVAGCVGDGDEDTPTATTGTGGTGTPTGTTTTRTPTETGTATPTPKSYDVDSPSNWTTFAGDGDFVPSEQGYDLIEEITNARQSWTNPTHTGIMKSGDGSAKAASEAGFDPTYGELTNPIAADGILFVSWNQPTGDVRMPKRDFEHRYWDSAESQEGLAESFTKIDANWRTIAVDADTGETLWEATEQSASVHFSPGKRGHHGISGAYGNGVYVTVTILGDVFAYDVDSGERLWHHELPFKETAQGHKDTWLENERLPNTVVDNPFAYMRYGSAVVGDVAAVPDLEGGMVGLSLEDGSQQWSVGTALEEYATPQIWNDGDADWLLCNAPGERGPESRIKLVDPANGNVAWTKESGTNRGPLILGDSHVMLNVRSRPLSVDPDWSGEEGLLACYELSPDGLTEVWRFEDADDNIHRTNPDFGAYPVGSIRDGILYIGLGNENTVVRSIDIASGEELDRDSDSIGNTALQPLPVEDKLFWQTDGGHDGNGLLMYDLDGEGGIERQGSFQFSFLGIDPRYGYEYPLTLPYYDGRVFIRATTGIYGIDLRKPLTEVAHVEFEGLWKGSPAPVEGRFIPDARGAIQTGRVLVPRQKQLGIPFTTGRGQNGWGLIGLDSEVTIGQAGETSSTFNWVTFKSDVDLSFTDGDSWGGSWSWTVPGLDEQRAFEGSIGSGASRTGFSERVFPTPELDDPYTTFDDLPDGQERIILSLPGVLPTVRHPNPLDERQNLTLCLDHDGESVVSGVGGAFSYNQAWHEVDGSEVTVTDDGLSGSLTVILHPDPWEAPNPAVGDFNRGKKPIKNTDACLAGTIELDATFGEENDEGRRPVSGSWSVTWGMELEKTGDIRVVSGDDQ